MGRRPNSANISKAGAGARPSVQIGALKTTPNPATAVVVVQNMAQIPTLNAGNISNMMVSVEDPNSASTHYNNVSPMPPGTRNPHKRNKNFTVEESNLLVTSWSSMLVENEAKTPENSSSTGKRKNTEMWQKLMEIMKETGCTRTSVQLKNRVYRLKQEYNRIVAENGVGADSFPYFAPFDAIYKSGCSDVKPGLEHLGGNIKKGRNSGNGNQNADIKIKHEIPSDEEESEGETCLDSSALPQHVKDIFLKKSIKVEHVDPDQNDKQTLANKPGPDNVQLECRRNIEPAPKLSIWRPFGFEEQAEAANVKPEADKRIENELQPTPKKIKVPVKRNFLDLSKPSCRLPPMPALMKRGNSGEIRQPNLTKIKTEKPKAATWVQPQVNLPNPSSSAWMTQYDGRNCTNANQLRTPYPRVPQAGLLAGVPPLKPRTTAAKLQLPYPQYRNQPLPPFRMRYPLPYISNDDYNNSTEADQLKIRKLTSQHVEIRKDEMKHARYAMENGHMKDQITAEIQKKLALGCQLSRSAAKRMIYNPFVKDFTTLPQNKP